MTSGSSEPEQVAPVLVWDTSPLLHSLRAGRLEILGDIARHGWIGERRNVTTKAVVSEIVYYEPTFAGDEWLEVVHVDDLGELHALVTWMERVSGANSNHGEATVLAWAEVHGATAVVDDADARRIGRLHGLDVCGSLRVVADAVRHGHTTAYAATALVDAMLETGARYPCARGDFTGWAKANGLL
ncbi:hypothetical protein ABZ114_23790 [Streptomyces albidoflavus]|uniref:hypothetical protein n=1 Tax=Streptomyces TaxID=1883 RepID=UPI00069EB7AD|nr:hypothetical protein [Streptomyces sp. KE1]